MTVAVLRLNLLVIGCTTQRDKHRRLKSIMDKLHKHFNISVTALDGDDPRLGTIVVAAVGSTRRAVLDTLERVADAVASHPRAELLGHAITEV